MKNQPTYTKRAGNISVSIFNNEFKNRADEKVIKKNVILQRGYKKKNSETWENEQLHFNNEKELMRAIFLLGDAQKNILMNDIEVTRLPVGHHYKKNTTCVCGHTLLEHDWDKKSECKVKGCKCKRFVSVK